MKIETFDNNRNLLCYENCGHETTKYLEVGHARILICGDCLRLLHELTELELSHE